MGKIKTLIVCTLMVFLSLPILRPIVDYGFFPVHDDMQIQRVFELASALRDGQFPVRILKNFGFGYHYPLYNFYSPLPYYIGAFFNLIGFNILSSVKFMFALANILSVIFMFMLVKYTTKSRKVAFLSGIMYAYFPYRAVDNYVRGAIGEIYVMMFLPLFILGIIKIFEKKNTALFVLSLAGIILSHNIYAFLSVFYFVCFMIGYLIFILINKKKADIFIRLCLYAALALGVTAFFWLPAVLEAKFTKLSILNTAGYYFGNYFIKFADLWQSDWGYGGAAGGVTFMIGKIHLLIGIIAAIFFFYRIIIQRKKDVLPVVFLSYFLFSAFLTNSISYFLWKNIPFLSFSQYPLRFLYFIDFFLILFIAFTFQETKKYRIYFFLLVVFCSTLLIWKNQGYFKSRYNYDLKSYMTSPSYMNWEISNMSSEYMPKEFNAPKNRDEISNGAIKSDKQISATIIRHVSNKMEVKLKVLKDNTKITFPISYFPGWKMYIDNKNVQPETATDKYLIATTLNSNDYMVKIIFENTGVRIIGNMVTLISIVLIVLLSFYYQPRK